jgi:sulfur-oxidizing protein SoxB
MDMTATTYSYATLTEMTGATIKTVLEDVCDNLFNPDPYYQQGGDMVRVGGLQYSCNPLAGMGKRIDEMRLNGKLIEADKKYKVAGWAPVAEEAKAAGGKMVWEVAEQWLKASGGKVSQRRLNSPKLTGVLPNPGVI